MGKQEATARMLESVSKGIGDLVRKQENPELVESVLRLAQHMRTGIFVDGVPQKLGIERDQAKNILEFLGLNGLVQISDRNQSYARVITTPDAETYLKSNYGVFEIEGLHHEWNELSKARTLLLMNSLGNLVNWSYEKKFEVAREDVRALEDKMKKRVERAGKEEEKFCRELLKLPKDVKMYRTVSFIRSSNPFSTDYGPRKHVEVSTYWDFKSPKEAMDTGFDKADAWPMPFGKENFPTVLEIRNRSQDGKESFAAWASNYVRLGMMADHSFAYRMDGKRKLDEIADRLRPHMS